MENLEELWSYFKSLPRPLPNNLSIGPGEFVVNAETFVDSHFNSVQHDSPQIAQVFYDRLILWKEAYEKLMASK